MTSYPRNLHNGMAPVDAVESPRVPLHWAAAWCFGVPGFWRFEMVCQVAQRSEWHAMNIVGTDWMPLVHDQLAKHCAMSPAQCLASAPRTRSSSAGSCFAPRLVGEACEQPPRQLPCAARGAGDARDGIGTLAACAAHFPLGVDAHPRWVALCAG